MSHIVEEESGTYVSRCDHAHNGYYAGDFSVVPFTADVQTSAHPQEQPSMTMGSAPLGTVR